MTAKDVIDLYRNLEGRGVVIWLDGGWGVDALLEEQTRPHKDVDIVIQEKDLSALHAFLDEKRYVRVPTDDERPWNYVVKGEDGKQIDVHVISIDENGDGIYGPKENGQAYPASALRGTGVIDGVTVKCLSPEYQVESHTGYQLSEKDYKDTSALCKKFNLPLPETYKDFVRSGMLK